MRKFGVIVAVIATLAGCSGNTNGAGTAADAGARPDSGSANVAGSANIAGGAGAGAGAGGAAIGGTTSEAGRGGAGGQHAGSGGASGGNAAGAGGRNVPMQHPHPGPCLGHAYNKAGAIQMTKTYTYDARGQLIKTRQEYPGSSNVDETTYIYDAMGNQLEEIRNPDRDGVPMWRSVQTYDAMGRKLSHTDYLRGTITTVMRYTGYDAAGHVLGMEEDTDGDGDVDWRSMTVVETLSDGRIMLTTSDDSNLDGKPDLRRIVIRDAADRILENRTDTDADGDFDLIVTARYDDRGFHVLTEEDTNADGTIDNRSAFTRDAYNNLTSKEVDKGADGKIEERDEWVYDDQGNLLKSSTDNDGDGTIDGTQTFDYGCW